MADKFKYVLDAAAGAGLALALLIVFVVDYATTTRVSGPEANTLENVKVTELGGSHGKRLKLGVTPSGEFQNAFSKKPDKWDDMGKLLDELGEGYKHDVLQIGDMINNPQALKEYDVIFLTCNNGSEEELKDVLQKYVTEGGILYASDWRFATVAAAFPELVESKFIGQGAKQELEADIVDPALSEALKTKKIHLKFDLGEWRAAAFGGPRVKTLMQGTYQKEKGRDQVVGGGVATGPLMVKFQVGKGTVIFTSFHNEKQNSEIEKKLLQYLVFSLVTAGIDAAVNSSLDQGGFTPRGSNLLSTPERNQTITKQYDNKTPGDLRFALGFRNEGAKLRFNIKAPDGKQYTWEGESTVILDVPNAQAGQWTYSVTDLQLPYENFPFTMTVGGKNYVGGLKMPSR
jgi:hypothetical protein